MTGHIKSDHTNTADRTKKLLINASLSLLRTHLAFAMLNFPGADAIYQTGHNAN